MNEAHSERRLGELFVILTQAWFDYIERTADVDGLPESKRAAKIARAAHELEISVGKYITRSIGHKHFGHEEASKWVPLPCEEVQALFKEWKEATSMD